MAIRLQSLRIKGFRGFRNIEIDFENITTTFVRKGDESDAAPQDLQGGLNG